MWSVITNALDSKYIHWILAYPLLGCKEQWRHSPLSQEHRMFAGPRNRWLPNQWLDSVIADNVFNTEVFDRISQTYFSPIEGLTHRQSGWLASRFAQHITRKHFQQSIKTFGHCLAVNETYDSKRTKNSQTSYSATFALIYRVVGETKQSLELTFVQIKAVYQKQDKTCEKSGESSLVLCEIRLKEKWKFTISATTGAVHKWCVSATVLSGYAIARLCCAFAGLTVTPIAESNSGLSFLRRI